MREIRTIEDFAPEGAEAGVGLALQDSSGRYLFFLAGTRHSCPPGELFYAGIGGHREKGEDWLTCAHREADEEIGATVELLSAASAWHIPQNGPIRELTLNETPRPLALYEMIHQPDAPRAGQLYRIIIYSARLTGQPANLPPDELLGVIALTTEQVIQGPTRKPALLQLLAEGASIIAGCETVKRETQLYPIGTARALAGVLSQNARC